MDSSVFFSRCQYSGHIQGVGFRYQVVSIAKGYELTGWVKNLNDGRVELFVEGLESEVSDFILAVESELDVFINHAEKASGYAERSCTNFSIIG
ncbi:MAG: acylphosphatase [Puniceicoccaceae bacterium]|nr:acylphosphatase [Puniceicoccaceae bacterium]RCL30540.1 MAG: acylphosphatase [Puniceicoccaceae bacterium]|tara:strand:+ start:244 stop:525 length:282 start_codon:yes stop_codon:yes gene_type:complete